MAFLQHRFLIVASLCAFLAACLFLPGLDGGFIFDDRPNIQENEALHVAQPTTENLLVAAYSYQPGHGTRALSMLSFALDYWRGGGLDPRVFKSTNLAIHAVTAFALALFFRQLLLLAQWPPRRAAPAAIALAGLWAILPLQVSAVLYVVQRMQTLGTLFLVLALWAYLKARHAQIDDRRSRSYFTLTALFWVLAFAAKEDSILLPAYTLVLELTILRFRAAQPALANDLRRAYLFSAIAGIGIYLLVVLPHYWNWNDYPGRTFSSAERILTQGRVLAMHIGQILFPLPERLPFFYDDLEISRGLLDPATTLPAWALLLALLAAAWRWRAKRPVFACGVLLFFAGHFITSNVINLEMAFEHRNHFPLIGAVLAIGDLCAAAILRWEVRLQPVVALTAVVFVVMGIATVVRAHEWGEPLRFARYSVEIAPGSERAWLALGETYAGFSGGRASSPYLEKAIETCQEGARRFHSAMLLSNIVNYKTIKGNVTPEDWERLQQSLRRVPMTLQNRSVIWTMISNAQRGIPMDERGVLESMRIVSSRTTFEPLENLRLASYAFSDTRFPDQALPYLKRAVEQSPSDDADIAKALSGLSKAGREDWVRELNRMRETRK